jgi:hypothetical protein
MASEGLQGQVSEPHSIRFLSKWIIGEKSQIAELREVICLVAIEVDAIGSSQYCAESIEVPLYMAQINPCRSSHFLECLLTRTLAYSRSRRHFQALHHGVCAPLCTFLALFKSL